jgi:hypothetical protein
MRAARLAAQRSHQFLGRNTGEAFSGIYSSSNNSCYSNYLFQRFYALKNPRDRKEANDNL